ncbi:MAG TPA: hypothetical protein VGQ76_08810 [Thermoanaerobaculia bacterium]|jgi:hypothetical protein|nr:hypothetical protein [Thermoanaerobaculia bacterium]
MNDTPTITASEIQRMISAELSPRARVGHTALLLVASAMAVVIASLWLTEPSLPLRTQVAFGLMTGIGLSWVAYSVWVLTRRRVMLAGHRILAARMAVTFTTIFVLGFLSLGIFGSMGRAAYAAAGTGAVMLAVAVFMLFSAHRRFAELMQRRLVIERELTPSSS